MSRRVAEWFKSLEPGSIGSFAELARIFVQRFSMDPVPRPDPALASDVVLHLPRTYEEALRRVTDYANAGEANSAGPKGGEIISIIKI
nr:uncharacterized protein LOC109156267 [Ipomoea batatas]